MLARRCHSRIEALGLGVLGSGSRVDGWGLFRAVLTVLGLEFRASAATLHGSDLCFHRFLWNQWMPPMPAVIQFLYMVGYGDF